MHKSKIGESFSYVKNLPFMERTPSWNATPSNTPIKIFLNRNQVPAKKRFSTSKNDGDTGLLPSKLYYCGSTKN
jgi:hypothetical protein